MNGEDAIKLINTQRPDLTHGRSEAVGGFLLAIFKSNKFATDPEFKKRQEMNLLINKKKEELSKILQSQKS